MQSQAETPKRWLFGMGCPFLLVLGLLSLLGISGCPAHKDRDPWHHKPTRAPLMPKDRDCGAPITFANGETWTYPCWPQKAEPKEQDDPAAELQKHIYNPKRLVVQESRVMVTGTWVDASHGRTGDGCRHEKDGDGHCFVKLDPGQEKYLNAKNLQNEDGNLVVEPICIYKVTQADAKAACKNFHQQISLPKIGSHVQITGVWVLDMEHGHMEIHPISSIRVLKDVTP